MHTTASVRRWLHTENIHLRGLSISMVAYAAGSIRNPTSWLKSIYVFINLLKYSGGLWVAESCTICGWFSSICPATMFMATMVLSHQWESTRCWSSSAWRCHPQVWPFVGYMGTSSSNPPKPPESKVSGYHQSMVYNLIIQWFHPNMYIFAFN